MHCRQSYLNRITERLPYGSKSAETVARYAVEAARYLESHSAQMLVKPHAIHVDLKE